MRGVSLDEISSATKISLRILDAIEREDFSKLPGGIFSRSFIRSYAATWVWTKSVWWPNSSRLPDHRRILTCIGWWREFEGTPLLATFFAVVLLAGGYALFHYEQRDHRNFGDAPAPAGGYPQAGSSSGPYPSSPLPVIPRRCLARILLVARRRRGQPPPHPQPRLLPLLPIPSRDRRWERAPRHSPARQRGIRRRPSCCRTPHGFANRGNGPRLDGRGCGRQDGTLQRAESR